MLGFSQDFFGETQPEGIPGIESSLISFRAKSTMPAKVRDYATASASFGVMLTVEILRRFQLPDSDVPQIHGDAPEDAAMKVRAAWGLGQRPLKNVVHLLESKGVRVLSLAEDHTSVDAFSFWHEGQPYVFLNAMSAQAKSGQRGRFDAAHELGHLVMHLSRPGDISGRKSEAEADAFSSAFLMPRNAVRAAVGGPRGFGLPEICHLKRKWGVSAMAMARRLKDIEVLSHDRYHRVLVQMSRRGWRTEEPDPLPRERSQVWAKIARSLSQEPNSVDDLARAIGVLPGDVGELVFGHVMTVAPRAKLGGSEGGVRTAKQQLRLIE